MKRIFSWFLIIITIFSLTTSAYLVDVHAVDLSDYLIIDSDDLQTIINKIFVDIGFYPNFDSAETGNLISAIRNFLISKGFLVDSDGKTYAEKNFYNGDKLDTTLLKLDEIYDLILSDIKQRDPIVYVSGKQFSEKFMPNMRYIVNTYSNSNCALYVYNLMNQFNYTVYCRSISVGEVLFWGIDDSSYKYAYLDSEGYIRFVNNDLSPSYGAIWYNSQSPIKRTSTFTEEELLLDYDNRKYSFDGRYALSDNSTPKYTYIDTHPSVDDEGNYYMYNMTGVMPVFTSQTDMMTYINSQPDYYLTENFYNRNYSNTTVTNVSNYTTQNMQNTYNTIVQGSQDAVTAEEMQKIIDEAVQKLIDSLPDDSGGSSSSTTFNVDLTETNNLIKENGNKLDTTIDSISDFYEEYIKGTNYLIDHLSFLDTIFTLLDYYLARYDSFFDSIDNKIDEVISKLTYIIPLSETLDYYLERTDNWLESFDSKVDYLIDGVVEGVTGGITLSDLSADIKSLYEKFTGLVKYCKSIDSKLSVLIGLETVDLINDLFGDDEDKDLSGLSGSFTALDTMKNKFPFSLPYEIYAVINLFASDPVVPVFNVPFQYELFGYSFDYQMTIDLTDYQWLSDYSRSILAIVFIVGLYKFTLLYVIKK